MVDIKEPGNFKYQRKESLIREQKSGGKEQIASEKIDSTHLRRLEDFLLVER